MYDSLYMTLCERQKLPWEDFPGGPVVKIPASTAGGVG